MTTDAVRMMRGALGGAALGGGIGGVLFTLAGAVMVGLEPVVFMLCGVYAGAVHGGMVVALRGARVELAPAIVRSRTA